VQKNTIMLIVSVVIAGAIGALKALAPLEPGWAWVTSAIPVLVVIGTYFTVPGTQAQRDAHANAAPPTTMFPPSKGNPS
jgi:hypothetical protein